MMPRSAALTALLLMFGVESAIAGADADTLLQRAYDNYRAQTSRASIVMTVHRPDWERQMRMSTWTRGRDDGVVRFTAPEKDAGNATLKLGHDTWVFNPKLNRIIKLPPSMMAQSWMGSDFSYNDLSKSEDILTDYTHRVTGVQTVGGHRITVIEAIPKPGAPVVWGKIDIAVRDDDVMTQEVYFDQDMKPARIMQADRIGTVGNRTYPLVMTMHPQDAPGQWTRIETLQAEFDIAAPDYLFTLSNLQNPRQ